MKNIDLSSFKKVDTASWQEAAMNQLSGKDPFDVLQWESHGLKDLRPYYDQADTNALSDQRAFFENLPSHAWRLYERVSETTSSEANKRALDALMGGCDGVIFETTAQMEPADLLKDIDLSICDVSMTKPVAGASGMNKKNCLILAENRSPIVQLKEVLGKMESSHAWIQRGSFADFFVEMATVRALRFILNNTLNGESVKIHTAVSTHTASHDFQWFLNTTSGLSSILGGTYSIEFPTAMGDSRISRNVGNIIREESGISEYQDQIGGSFYVESLTHQILQKVESEL